MEIKYVMIDEIWPVLFVGQAHSDMKKLGNITSAGFIRMLENGTIYTYGHSQSLNMKPADRDEGILEVFLYNLKDL